MKEINVIKDSNSIIVSVENEQDVIEYKFDKDKFMEVIRNNAHEIKTYNE